MTYFQYAVVTVDKLQLADDDQAAMPSAPPTHTMEFIQGYDAVPMDDGRAVLILLCLLISYR